MKQNKISLKQLMAILWGALLAPAAELLPAITVPVAGRGAWLSALLAAPVMALAGFLLWRLCRQGEGLGGACVRVLGAAPGKTVILLYIVWGLILLALRLRLCAQRLMGAGYRDGSLSFLLVTAAGMALWISWGKLPVVARTAEALFACLVVTGVAVVALAAPQVQAENLLPLWREDALPILQAVCPTLGVLGYGIYAAFLLGETERGEKRAGRWLQWTAAGCVMLALMQLVVVGNFGPALTQQLSSPFFNLAKSIGVTGAFQRVESVVAAFWTFSDLAIAALLLRSIEAAVGGLVPGIKKEVAMTAAILPCVAAAFAAFPDGIAAELMSRREILWGNVLFGVILPLFICVVARLRRKDK